jgi:hypothetical protein
MISVACEGKFLCFYNHYDSYLDGGLGDFLVDYPIDTEDMENHYLPMLHGVFGLMDDEGIYQCDDADALWSELVPNGVWEWYYSHIADQPCVAESYNYMWDGSKWMVYDDFFDCWRPLLRVMKRKHKFSIVQSFDYMDYEPPARHENTSDLLLDRYDMFLFYCYQQVASEDMEKPVIQTLMRSMGMR